ncbi:hypothetical protein [Shinella granuli]|uniref:hypothetical protein n=1 Tax=Shinella granuli TaxID=323621 RepID=UPI0010545187|nr:hypothetical protein [Shinella granuli]
MNLRYAFALGGLFWFISSAGAQPPDIPVAYHGKWQVVAKIGDAPTCSAADADIRMTVNAREISLPDGYCMLHGILPGDESTLQFEGYCAQEDAENIIQQEWRVTKIGQRQYLTVKSLTPGEAYEYYYVDC